VNGQLNLVENCYSRLGRHDYSLGSNTPGPNVFVNDRGYKSYADSGPHHRWSTGALFDNVKIWANEINVENRGNSGSGQGWAGANMVVWNSTASRGFIVQNPPTAQNWLIGPNGSIVQGTMYVGPKPAQGVTESPGRFVPPSSLYDAQHQEQ